MSASVIILPVVRVERDPIVPVQANVSLNARIALQRLADRKHGGDLRACCSQLLEACAGTLAVGIEP